MADRYGIGAVEIVDLPPSFESLSGLPWKIFARISARWFPSFSSFGANLPFLTVILTLAS